MTRWYKEGCQGDLQPIVAKAKCRISVLLKDKYGLDMFLTSQRDSQHGDITLHPDGWAFDFRAPMTSVGVPVPLDEIKEAAGKGFDVVREKDHDHVEYDPK